MKRQDAFRSFCVAALAATLISGIGGCAPPNPDESVEPDSAPSPPAVDAPAAPEAGRASVVDGKALYSQHCAMCHMEDGMGVPNFQPPIVGSPSVRGDALRLEAVIRAGSAVLTGQENPFGNEMPPFGHLADDEIGALVAFVRENFKSGHTVQQR